jgi:hypothetical protein
MPAVLTLAALFQGSAMPVAQVIAQSQAGAGMLGSAAAAIQLSRSVGSAIGVALVGAVLFMVLSRADSQTALLFRDMVAQGPLAMDGLEPVRQAVVRVQVADAFGAAFGVIAIFAGLSGIITWTMPTRRL